jgi:alkylhydroperoxidase family enzyme
MLKFLARQRIRGYERRLGEPLDYLRHILAASFGAFRAFARAAKVAGYRKHLPAAPHHVARIVAVRHEDCGPCVQTVVNLAKADGVPDDVLRAALDRRVNDLPESLRDVYRFTEAVVELSGEEEPYRERLRQVFGEAALCELALAIATCRLFPTVKRALGYATSCSLVKAEV